MNDKKSFLKNHTDLKEKKMSDKPSFLKNYTDTVAIIGVNLAVAAVLMFMIFFNVSNLKEENRKTNLQIDQIKESMHEFDRKNQRIESDVSEIKSYVHVLNTDVKYLYLELRKAGVFQDRSLLQKDGG